MVAAVGLASMLIALSFAEVGSRFEGTGGPYLYTRAAFGRFAAFEVGWMLWFTRAASWAAVINVLATSLGYYWPALRDRRAAGRRDHADHRRHRRRSTSAASARAASSSTSLTIGKLVPLVVFIAAGLFAIDPSRLAIDQPLTLGDAAASGLLLIFAFGGYEVVPVVAGETKDPRRAVPFALIMTIVVVDVDHDAGAGRRARHAARARHLDDAARERRGSLPRRRRRRADDLRRDDVGVGQQHGAGAVGHRATCSRSPSTATCPPFFGRVHPRFRTPVTAVIFTAAVSLVLALSGRFAALAAVSAVSRLIVYVFTCAATIRLRHPRFAAQVPPAVFTRAVRSGDSGAGDRVRAGDPCRRDAAAAAGRRDRARGRRRALRCRALFPRHPPRSAASETAHDASSSVARCLSGRCARSPAATAGAAQPVVFLGPSCRDARTRGMACREDAGADPDLSRRRPGPRERARRDAEGREDHGRSSPPSIKRTSRPAQPAREGRRVSLTVDRVEGRRRPVGRRSRRRPATCWSSGTRTRVPEVIKALGVTEPVTIAEDEFDDAVRRDRASPPTMVRLRY